MVKIVYEPVPKGKEKEAAKQNEEDYKAYYQRVMNMLKGLVAAQKEQGRRDQMVALGQLRRKYILDGNLEVSDDYKRISCNGKTKELKEGTQMQIVVKQLARASKTSSYKVEKEALIKVLERDWDDGHLGGRCVTDSTIRGVRDELRKYFGLKIIDADGQGKYWLNRSLLGYKQV